MSRPACKVTDPVFGMSSALGPRLLDAQPKAAAADLHFSRSAQVTSSPDNAQSKIPAYFS